MAKEPSEKQLDYLKVLGYRGIQPRTMTEASILIDEMKSSGDSNAAAEILGSYRTSAPMESSGGGGTKGCLVMLLLIGGCVYWRSNSKDRQPPRKPAPVPQIVIPLSPEVPPSVPPTDQPAAESPRLASREPVGSFPD